MIHRKDDARHLKHRTVSFKAEKVEDDGTFEGYGSVFGNVDSYGEVVEKGAFADSLKRIKDSGDPLPALWQHRSAEVVGGYDTLKEDDRGLATTGFLMVNEVALAREVHALMKRRVVKGLSIGYYVEESSFNEKTGIRTLQKLDLQEISIVTFPANALAQVDAVKAAACIKTVREFEDFLRDVGGFTNSQAKRIASTGWRAVDGARDGSDEALQKSLEAIASFQLPTL